MKTFICVVAGVVLCLGLTAAKDAPPKVQVYTRKPGYYGKANTLICHVSDFHPPEITIELLRNGVVMPEAKQTDLAFDGEWHYHLTKHALFTPTMNDKFSCRVTHKDRINLHDWEADE